jgi:membrane protein YqaA with SNARE-associated domain
MRVPPRRLVLLWSMAEATVWPLMPDAALVPLAAARPAEWWRLALLAAVGSAVGGAISYAVGRVARLGCLLGLLPMVRPAMVTAADAWLTREGASAVRRQPLSSLPFKILALLAGARRVPLGPFLCWTIAARGARFLIASGLAALLARRFQPLVRRYPRALMLLWGILFLVGLRRTVLVWERRATS